MEGTADTFDDEVVEFAALDFGYESYFSRLQDHE